MLNQSKKSPALYFFLKRLFIVSFCLCIISILSSCSDDNPVKPSASEFDTARYNWRGIEISSRGFAAIWSLDTNKIFLANHDRHSLYVISSGIVSFYNFGSNYFVNEMDGLSNNEIYMFGGISGGQLAIIKWNGAGFEFFPANLYTNDDRSVRGCAINSSEIWILSPLGIAKFDGNSFIYYSYADPHLIFPMKIFKSVENKIEYIANGMYDTTSLQHSLYQFEDTSFKRVYYDSVGINPPRYSTELTELNGFKYGFYINSPLGSSSFICLKNFTGSGFSDYACFDKKIHLPNFFRPGYLVGINLQNCMTIVSTDPSVFTHTRVGVMQWNGSRLSKELEFIENDPNGNVYDVPVLYDINESSYVFLEPHAQDINATLHIASRK